MNWLDYQVNNFTRNYYNKSLGFIQLSYIERQQGYLKKKDEKKKEKKKIVIIWLMTELEIKINGQRIEWKIWSTMPTKRSKRRYIATQCTSE